jgi:tetratricopeptide (TPR) repeat protein
MNRISFKVYFALDNIRRFTCESIPTLLEFNSITSKLSPASQARRVQYKDDEEDLITIDSEGEWEEMFSQFPDLKLYRIYLSELSNIERPKPWWYCHRPCRPNIEREEWLAKPWYSRYRPCRRGAIFPYGLQRRGLNLLTEKQYNEASHIFRTQCNLQPDNPTPFYNVACSESLMGNTANALEYLEKAINLGFNDLEHMLKDEDLVNIHNTYQFKTACDRLRHSMKPQNPFYNNDSRPTVSDQNTSPINNDIKPMEPQQNTTDNKPKPTEPSKPAQKASPWASQLEKLRDMGYNNDELILRLLENFKGDIQRTLLVLIGDE